MKSILLICVLLYQSLASAQANTSLSNLSSTSINESLVPDAASNFRTLGTFSQYWYVLYTQGVNFMNGTTGNMSGTLGFVNSDMPSNSEAGIIGLRGIGTDGSTSNSVAVYSASLGSNTGKIYLETGNTSGGDSGDISLRTGTASGKRGAVVLDAQSLRVPMGSSDPAGVEGSIYYNTLAHKLRIYNGSVWTNVN